MKLTIDLTNPDEITRAIGMLKSMTQADPFRVSMGDMPVQTGQGNVMPCAYRELMQGELIQHGDEYLASDRAWVRSPWAGSSFRDSRFAPHRRKI
jgi:hypothetical protein